MSLMHRRRAVVARQRYAGKKAAHPHEEDFKGKRERANARRDAQVLEANGAAPVPARSPAKPAPRRSSSRKKSKGRRK